ncbi:iron uptake porin [Rivularia sp. UHCC 0363]|uniref:iron uptake porin n=1 Tax=Rivularia sp. UHCC 0363 TaxID=3110244 RepID=UPI002B207C6B|nr:iron uptake porin [Rivularia sp. UHCC 0363]MEA5592881.1 iron uptake porin [Rivularia sp. UHCC 0363]
MAKLLFNVLKLSPIVLAATFFVSNGAFAAEEKVNSVDELAQVTSVSQLSDVQPSDWAFQAVQSLVERYGCIAGYPDGTFKGSRALTRYEFAAGLNACLERMTQLIAASGNGNVSTEDMATVDKLRQEFGDELAALRGSVDALEYRTGELESNQFSTTTKLKGEAIFAVSDVFGGKDFGGAEKNNGDNAKTTLSDRVRLTLSSSFNGKDELALRLQANNITSTGSGLTGTNMTRLGFEGDNKNAVEVDKLYYSFKPSDKLTIKVDAIGAEMQDNTNTFNPIFQSSGSGAISRYGRFNPIYRVANGQSAVTATYGDKNTPFGLTAAYVSAKNSNNPATGIFEGDETFFGQVEFKPSKKLSLGLAYANANKAQFLDSNSKNAVDSIIGSTGSGNANKPFGNVSTSANYYSAMASYQLNTKTTLSGWYGFANADEKNSTNSADINYWAATLGIKDFGAEGNTLGLIFGQPPKVTGGSGTFREDTNGTSYHLEGLYKIKMNDRIEVTPGLLVIFNPEHNNANDTVYVGTVRTTFKF